jgi:hypothetical protein
LYASADPVGYVDPSGTFSSAFGLLAHEVIGGRYLFEHPWAQVNPLTGVLGSLKPDILDPVRRSYAEIKPLTFGGVASGLLQMSAYDRLYGKRPILFHRELAWPLFPETVWIADTWLTYFNWDGFIFYTDAEDASDLIKEIKDLPSLYRALRQLASKSLNNVVDWAKRLISRTIGAEEGEAEEDDASATGLGALGGVEGGG